jgi:hypothetical protein
MSKIHIQEKKEWTKNIMEIQKRWLFDLRIAHMKCITVLKELNIKKRKEEYEPSNTKIKKKVKTHTPDQTLRILAHRAIIMWDCKLSRKICTHG